MAQTGFKITNGCLLDPKNGTQQHADLFVQGERIVGIGNEPAGFVAGQEIDAGGHWVMPGVVDLAVRLPEPGNESSGSIHSELAAAVAGGVTTVCCTPNTQPVIDNTLQ